MTKEQIKKAETWYSLHDNHVNQLIKTAKLSYPPTEEEDKNEPSIWKAEHWKWFKNEMK